MKESYTEVRCDYLDSENFWCIDAWRTTNDDEEGRVIAVIHEPDGDVYYIEPEAMISPKAQEVIESMLKEMKGLQCRIR